MFKVYLEFIKKLLCISVNVFIYSFVQEINSINSLMQHLVLLEMLSFIALCSIFIEDGIPFVLLYFRTWLHTKKNSYSEKPSFLSI